MFVGVATKEMPRMFFLSSSFWLKPPESLKMSRVRKEVLPFGGIEETKKKIKILVLVGGKACNKVLKKESSCCAFEIVGENDFEKL